MKLIDMTCPHCGARLAVDTEANQAKCEHCGSILLIDDEVKHIQYDNIEQAGYNFEKGRQRAQAEYINEVSNPPKKRRTWLWVLGWIFVFPLPLTILLLRKKDMKPLLKYGIIGAAWLLYIIFAIAGNHGSNDEGSRVSYETVEPTVNAVKSISTEEVFYSEPIITEYIATLVPVLAESIAIDETKTILVLDESIVLTAEIYPENAEDKTITWSSSDDSVASVDEKGAVKAMGAGTAEITAATQNGVSASVNIVVDGAKRLMTARVTQTREDNNNIGSEWNYYHEINGEKFGGGTYIVSVGDKIKVYAKYTEFDNNPDIGEVKKTYSVTEEDIANGFVIEMELYVKENGGIYNGKSAHFIVTFTFSPME